MKRKSWYELEEKEEETYEEKLDKIPIEVIEKYLRKKKLERIKKDEKN